MKAEVVVTPHPIWEDARPTVSSRSLAEIYFGSRSGARPFEAIPGVVLKEIDILQPRAAMVTLLEHRGSLFLRSGPEYEAREILRKQLEQYEPYPEIEVYAQATLVWNADGPSEILYVNSSSGSRIGGSRGAEDVRDALSEAFPSKEFVATDHFPTPELIEMGGGVKLFPAFPYSLEGNELFQNARSSTEDGLLVYPDIVKGHGRNGAFLIVCEQGQAKIPTDVVDFSERSDGTDTVVWRSPGKAYVAFNTPQHLYMVLMGLGADTFPEHKTAEKIYYALRLEEIEG